MPDLLSDKSAASILAPLLSYETKTDNEITELQLSRGGLRLPLRQDRMTGKNLSL